MVDIIVVLLLHFEQKILFTFAALFIFKLGTAIIVPGIDKNSLTGNLGFLELMNAMGGGAMERFSIFALGVMPYITASIIIQLLSMDIIPYLSELSKQGATGRNKMNQITRIAGIVLAFIQGYIYSFTYVSGNTPIEYIEFALILTAGTSFLLWLGDQITAKGIGNGISLIIMAGIIANLPTMFVTAWDNLVDLSGTTQSISLGVTMFVLFIAVYIAIVLGIIYEETAERRIPIQYANKSTSTLGKQTYIPFKLNSAGVMPVIFASALLSIPQIIASVIGNEKFILFAGKYLSYTKGTGLVLYIVLILAFAYFYTFMQLKPKEMADNLGKNGGYIPGIRPGEETVKYVNTVLKRITIVGAVFLATLSVLPIIFENISNLTTQIAISGTGVLIAVGVALETFKQIESQLISNSYNKGRRGRRR